MSCGGQSRSHLADGSPNPRFNPNVGAINDARAPYGISSTVAKELFHAEIQRIKQERGLPAGGGSAMQQIEVEAEARQRLPRVLAEYAEDQAAQKPASGVSTPVHRDLEPGDLGYIPGAYPTPVPAASAPRVISPNNGLEPDDFGYIPGAYPTPVPAASAPRVISPNNGLEPDDFGYIPGAYPTPAPRPLPTQRPTPRQYDLDPGDLGWMPGAY